MTRLAYNTSSVTVDANSAKSITLSIPQVEGYTPLAYTAYYTGNARLSLYRLPIVDSKNMFIFNPTSLSVTIDANTAYAQVLYVKNIE